MGSRDSCWYQHGDLQREPWTRSWEIWLCPIRIIPGRLAHLSKPVSCLLKEGPGDTIPKSCLVKALQVSGKTNDLSDLRANWDTSYQIVTSSLISLFTHLMRTCVCVCVHASERERENERMGWAHFPFLLSMWERS